MGNTLAKASLQLTADSGGLSKGLNDADGKIRTWGAKQAKTTEKVGKDSGQKAAKGMSDEMSDGKKGGWLSRLSSIATGAAGIIATVASKANLLKHAFDSVAAPIERTTKAARELGVGVEGFSALEHAAKVTGATTDDLSSAVATLQTNLDSAEGARYFDELGLSATALKGLSLDSQLATIADALAEVKDPADRARLSLAVLGDRAVALGPLLEKGGDGIRSLTDEARRTGVAFDSVSAAKVTAAQEAIRRAGAAWSGLMNSVAIGAAPWVEWSVKALGSLGSVWDFLQKLGTGFTTYVVAPILQATATLVDAVSNVSSAISSAFGGAFDAVAGALDTLSEAWHTAWEAMGEAASSAADWTYQTASSALDAIGIDSAAVWKTIGDGVEWLKNRFSDLWAYVRSMWDWIFAKSKGGDALRATADSIANMAEAGPAAEKAGKVIGDKMAEGIKQSQLNNVKAPLLKAVTDLQNELMKSIETVGMTGAHAKITDLANKGVDAGQLDKLRDLADTARKVQDAWSLVEEFNPTETWERQLSGLDKMLEDGRISWEQYAKGIAKAGKQLQDAAGVGPLKSVSGAVINSSAAVSAIIKSDLQSRPMNDPAATLRQAQMEIKEINKQQLQVAEKMLAAIEAGNNEDEWEQV